MGNSGRTHSELLEGKSTGKKMMGKDFWCLNGSNNKKRKAQRRLQVFWRYDCLGQ